MGESRTPRRRRRVTKKSPAGDYDRSMDAPGGPIHEADSRGKDGARPVELDEDAPTLSGEELYLNERPPHHGG